MRTRSCSCRSWELSGLPCSHVTKVILSRNEDVEEYLSHSYSQEKYLATYRICCNQWRGRNCGPSANELQYNPQCHATYWVILRKEKYDWMTCRLESTSE